MLFLILTVLFTTAIYVVFKMFDKKGIQLLPAIVFNYITAFSLGVLFIPDKALALEGASKFPTWFIGGVSLGIFFISVFYLTGMAAQRIGMSVTTIASKMSLVLAMALFIILRPHEKLTMVKVSAMLFAVSGVIFSSIKEGSGKFSWRQLGWPLLILVGSTIVDFGIAYFSAEPTNESEVALYSCLSFATAAFIGITLLSFMLMTKRIAIRKKDVLGGLILGTVNYSSIYTMVLAFKSQIMPESSMLPIINLCIVILGSIVAVSFFKEKLSGLNLIGIVLAVVAILFLIFGQ